MKQRNLLSVITLLLAIVAWTFPKGAAAQVNLTSGLVAYYPFNGNANDASGNNNNGTASGSAAPTADQWGNPNSAFNFAGTGNPGRVSVPNNATLQFSTGATFAFWMKLNSNVGTNGYGNVVAGGSHCPFAKDGDVGGMFQVVSLNGTTLNNSFGNVSMSPVSYAYSPYSVGTWLHYTYIMDATEQRLYINGTLVATVAGAPNFSNMNGKPLVMGRFTSNWYPLNGTLDEFRVYNRALNTAEIAALANNTVTTITVSNVNATTFCAGDSIHVDYTSGGGFMAANTFDLQLSDTSGSFAYPLSLSTTASTAASGTLHAVIPAGVPSGTSYKVRIVSNTPSSTSAASSQALTVNSVLGDIPNLSSFRYIGTVGGQHYYVSTIAQTWTQAQSTCQANGGNLATVTSAAVNTLLTNNLPSGGGWIGFTDQASEGTFVWVDGSPVTYTNWNTGEPNNVGNEDYTILTGTGKWNDLPASSSTYYFMQLAAATTPSAICEGSTLTLFSASATGATYSWTGPNSFISSQQNPVISNATIDASGTYTVSITSGGCTATASVAATVNHAPAGIGQNAVLPSSLSTGLVLYYPMDGNTNDASGNNINGTIAGGVTATKNRFDATSTALAFNGSNGYIDVPDGVYFNGSDFSISSWVKMNSYGSWARLMDFGNGPANNNVLVGLTNGTTGRPAAEIYVSTATGGQITSPSTTLPVAQWALLTYTWSNGTGRLYINGTQVVSGTQATPNNILRTLNYIGRSNWSNDAYANASFDDFRIYNRMLSVSEIRSLLLEQPGNVSMYAAAAGVCLSSGTQIVLVNSQVGVSYQLQNASTNANVGSAQNGNGDTLFFSTGTLTAATSYHIVATVASTGCSKTLLPAVAVSVFTPPSAPATTGASICNGGSVTLSAAGAPSGGQYNWWTVATGGTAIAGETAATYATPVLNASTTYYVSALDSNGCTSPRTAVTATIINPLAPAVSLDSLLIIHYQFDGNTSDSSGRGNNASINWSGTYVNDRLNQPAHALNIASGNYVDCGNPWDIQSLANQVTISMWIRQTPGNWGFFSPLVNKFQGSWGGLYMGMDNYYDTGLGAQQNRVRWRIDANSYVNSSVNVPYNQWHHIVCTYDGSSLKIYQNGVLTGSAGESGNVPNTSAVNLQIGRQANGSGNATYNGDMDEVRIYRRALNTNEIMTLYNNESVAFANTPLCEGSMLQLNTVALAGATYSWSGPNSFSSSQQTPSAITNATAANNAGVYTLTIVNNGCTAPPQTVNVVINPIPSAPITVHDTVCGSGNAVLSASGTPSGGSYLWYSSASSAAPVAGQTSSTFTINNLAATDTFYVSAVSLGCESPRTPVYAVYNNPVLTNLTVTGSTVCSSVSSANVDVQGTQAGVDYQAFTGSTAVSAPVAGGGNIIIPVNTALLNSGSNIITIHATQPGCGTVNITDTAAVVINVPATPTVTASGATSFCQGDSVLLIASAGSSYLWSTGAIAQSIYVNASGSYSVTVTDANGCSATSAATNVTVTPVPNAVATASGSTTFCQGGSVTLTASGGTTYLWSNGSNSPSINATAGGNYYVIAYNGSCADTSSTVAVTVNALPTAAVTAGGPTTFCQGGSVTLTASAGSSYLWSDNSTTQSITVNQSGNYSVTVTGANGCSSTSSPVSVTVNAVPNATVTAGGPTTFCQGGSVTLTASGGSSYSWSDGSTGTTLNVMQSGTYSVVASNGSCVDTSSSITVTVDPVPSATITASGATSFCQGGSVTLTAPAGGTYLWSDNSTTQSIIVNQSGNYTVTVTNASNCSATSSAVTVTVNPVPTAAITANGPVTFCQGSNVMLSASGGTSYLWSDGSTGATLTVTQSGSYYVIVSDGSCSDTSSVISSTVNPLPVVTLSFAQDTFCTVDPSVALSGGSPAGGIFGGPGVSGNTFDPMTAGYGLHTIVYTYTDTNGCSNTASAFIFVDVCTGIDDQPIGGMISAVPNPATDNVKIAWPAEAEIKLLMIIDVTGRVLQQHSVANVTSLNVDLHEYASGMYFVRLIGNGTSDVKIVKQ